MEISTKEITEKVTEILKNTIGFEFVVGNPRSGKMMVSYNNDVFYIDIVPVLDSAKMDAKNRSDYCHFGTIFTR